MTSTANTTVDNTARVLATTATSSVLPTTPPSKFLTPTEIAARFGVTLAAVSNWRRRYGPDSTTPFPAPEAGHPTPVWRRERWPEIQAWDEQRGGRRRGRRRGTRRPADTEYLSVQGIADRLSVAPRTVRQWRSQTWSIPFPQPDKEIVQKTRTLARWRVERWPDIQWWREWHLNHLATRRQHQDPHHTRPHSPRHPRSS